MKTSLNIQQHSRCAKRLVVCRSFITAAFVMCSVIATNPATVCADEVTYIWNLTFTGDKVTPIGAKAKEASNGEGENSESGKSNEEGSRTLTQMVAALNTAYGKPPKPARVENVRGRYLVVHGDESTVLKIRRDLTMLDAQWPQVQLDMWAVQIAGTPQEIAAKNICLQEKFLRARESMQIAKNHLLGMASAVVEVVEEGTQKKARIKQGVKFTLSAATDATLIKKLEAVGFDTNPDRRVSLTEALAFIALHENPKLVIEALQQKVADSLNAANSARPAGACDKNVKAHSMVEPDKLFRRLLAAMPEDRNLAKKTIEDFAGAFVAVNKAFSVAAPNQEQLTKQNIALNRLPQRAAALDLLLQSGMDAFTDDMQEMFLRPILKEIQAESSQAGLRGVALAGKTRQVVSNNLESRLDPEMSFSVNTTRPEPLNAEKLAEVFGGGVISGVKVLALNQPQPEMTTVSPGIGIHVVPNILKNGSAARLQIEVKIAVETATPDATANRLKSIPADAVKSHNIHTDAMISGFDLFDISSFSIETSHPRSRYLPLIGSIPLLGELIKKPRKNKVVHHESMIFVNAAILPRAMSLASNYGN